jgi:serine/threonine protein kinase
MYLTRLVTTILVVMPAYEWGLILDSLRSRLEILENDNRPMILSGDIGRFVIGDGTNTLIRGNSDDGFLLKVLETPGQGEYVVKVFKRNQYLTESSPEPAARVSDTGASDPVAEGQDAKDTKKSLKEESDAIVRDQAVREIKALTLLKGHPNIPTVLSTELDTCVLRRRNGQELHSWAIRMEYVPGLSDIRVSTLRFLGYVIDDAGHGHIDFGLRNRLALYLFGQVASITDALRRHGIEHRDIDGGNFKIQVPTLRLYLYDFARANVPHVDGMDETRNPDDILAEAIRVVKRSPTQDLERNRWLRDHKAEKYRNFTKYSPPRQLLDRDEISDGIKMFYMVVTGLHHNVERMNRHIEGYYVETFLLQQLINDVRVKFDQNLTSLLRYQTAIPWDLEQFAKTYKVSQSDSTYPLYDERFISVKHSKGYSGVCEEMKDFRMESMEIVWQ